MGFSLQGFYPLPSLADPLGSGPLPDVDLGGTGSAAHMSTWTSPSRLYSRQGFDTCDAGVNQPRKPLPSWVFTF
jgi:hypothetical protein